MHFFYLYIYTLGSYCDLLGTSWKLLDIFGHMSYYWCHSCSDRVAGSADNSGEPTCGNCGDTFVEELEEGVTSEALGSSQRDENVSRDGGGPSSEQQQAQRQDRGGGSAAGSQPQEIWLPLGSIFGGDVQNQQQRGGTRESASGGQTDMNPDVSVAITQLLSRLVNSGAHSAEAGGGGGDSARVQRLGGAPMELSALLGGEFITLNGTGGLAGTIGDYAIGDIDRVIEQLIDPNQVSLRAIFLHLVLCSNLMHSNLQHGTPPATQEEIDSLPSVYLKKDTQCSVCMENVSPGTVTLVMPCEHVFHSR